MQRVRGRCGGARADARYTARTYAPAQTRPYFASLQAALDVLALPLVQAVLRDATVMRPVLAQDDCAVLRAPSMEALPVDVGLVQRIAGLSG